MDSFSREHPVIAVHRELSRLLSIADEVSQHQENPRKIAVLLKQIQTLFFELDTICSDELASPICTALQGILNDLRRLSNILLLYKSKSRLYLLVKCRSLNGSLNTLVRDIASCLPNLTLGLHHYSELRKKIDDLSFDLRQTEFRVSEIENRICVAINKEISDGTSDQAAQNALMSDIVRALGLGGSNRNHLFAQIALLKQDIEDSSGDHDVQVAYYLEQVLGHGSAEQEGAAQPNNEAIDVEQLIPPFKSFICPLSREVMKTPVVLETMQTYEQNEIEKWFKHCQEEGRQPTCPVTQQVLTSVEWKLNAGLQKAIEEWLDRNYKIRISIAKQKLEVNEFKEDFEQAIEEVHRISKESPIHRHTLRNEGLIPLLLRPWQGLQHDCRHIRTKALTALHCMTLENDENKLAIAEANAVKFAVRSLTSSLEEEKESAALLLRELSSQPQISQQIGRQKGAIVLLSGQADNAENNAVSNLANEVLRRLEEQPSNIIPMAEAGRLRPLLDCLCEGSGETRLQMCEHLGQMTLSSSDKELAVRRTSLVLIEMLSYDVTEKTAALQTLLRFSTPISNAIVLVNSGILPPLFNLLMSVHPLSHSSIIHLKETAAEILVNLVSEPGHWEVAVVDSAGNTLQSELVIHGLLQLMTRVGFTWKPKLLQLVYFIASSPQAADAAVPHIQSGGGITRFIVFMQEADVNSRLYALMLLSILSSRIGTDVAAELEQSGQFVHLVQSLQDTEKSSPEERAEVACILANIPLTDADVIKKLPIELIPWIVAGLKELRGSSHYGRNRRTDMKMIEGLLGILLQFCRSSNQSVLIPIQENGLMMVFKEHVVIPGHSALKKRAAEGLKMLSQKAACITRNDTGPSTSHGWFSLFSLCVSKRSNEPLCCVHGIHCEANSAFCLVEANAIGPLVQMLDDDSCSVQLAAIEALSTLLDYSSNVKGGVELLTKEKGIECIFDLFCKATPGELQYRTLWMIEKILLVENICHRYSMDQRLIKALVQAFKTSGETRILAQTVLTALKQISGVSSGTRRRRLE